jgi:hypothetical protein
MKGQLGCTSRKSSNIPVPIMGFTENLRIVQLACSNYSGFLDDMGKLYLWGFGDQNSQIEPLKQDFDIPIKYFSLWKDNCVIVDETGRVLTLDEQVYKSALDIECHFSLRVEGRTISKVSTGNKFFMCLPHRPLIRQPSTPNMADNYTLKTRTPNYLDGDPHSDNNNFAQTRQFSRESPDKEIMEHVNADDMRMPHSMKSYENLRAGTPKE